MILKYEKTDYFDAKDLTESTKKEFMEYMLGYSEKGYYNYCTACNGSFNVNNKKIPVGEQLQSRK